jgi:FtsZ-binding cell division protein ZapB
LIEELQAEVKLLTVELESVKKSRDTYQAENAQLKKQVAAQQRKIKSLESK